MLQRIRHQGQHPQVLGMRLHAPRGPDQNQRQDPLRKIQSQTGADGSAHRDSAYNAPIDPEKIHQRAQILCR